MTSASFVSMAPTTGEDYGLDAVAQHNAASATEAFPPYQEDAKGLGIYVNSLFRVVLMIC